MEFLNFLLILPELFMVNFFTLFLWVALYIRVKVVNKPLFTLLASYTIFLLIGVLLLLVNFIVVDATVFYSVYKLGYFETTLKVLTLVLAGLIFALASRTRSVYNLTLLHFDVELLYIQAIVVLSMLFVISVNDLVYMFFILELYALAAYILVGYKGKFVVFSSEAAIKYFILSTVFSIVMAYSVALIYLATGITTLDKLIAYLTVETSSAITWNNFDVLSVAVMLLLIAFLFKLAASPFHFWAPDVYDGAPTTTMLFLVVVPKLALLGILSKLSCLWTLGNCFTLIIVSIILNVIIGSVGGVFQKRIKRLLTYSMINNNGFLLLPLLIGSAYGYTFLFYFAFIYLFSVIGIFSAVLALKLRSTELLLKNIWAWTNLFFINKSQAIILTILLFSSAGLPPLVGFLIKFLILYSVILPPIGFYALISVVLILVPVSCFYYIRIIKIMAFNRKAFWLFLETPSQVNAYMFSLMVVLLVVFFLCSGTILNFLTLILF